MSEKKEDQWKTIGIFGPIIYKKKSKELRDEKYVTDVEVEFLKVKHLKTTKMDYKKELDYLYASKERNELISDIANGLSNNTLILVNHLAHGDALYDMISGVRDKVFFVKGEMSVEEREIIKQKMETDNDIITIAMSSIFSTGINIKNIHNIMFVAGGKSFIRTVQSIGRGLRLHKAKNKLRIIDVYDTMKYSERHAEERKRIYEKEEILWRERVIDL